MGALLRRVALAATVAAGAAAGCGPSQVQLPPIPTQIQSVAAEYDAPTGTVPVGAATQIEDLQQRLDTINSTRLGDIVSSGLVSLRARLDASGLATDPVTTPKRHRPVIIGSVTLKRICRGWDDASTTPNTADGWLQVTAEYDGSMLQRIVFGTASACHDRVAVTDNLTVHTYLDGSLAIYLEGALPRDPSQATFLMGWNGTIGTENGQAAFSFDFRVVPPLVEVRIPVDDGNIIGSIGANEVSLRGANGTFSCSLVTFTCSLPQTARGAAPTP